MNEFFKQNGEITLVKNPLVEENVFLQLPREVLPLPGFAENRDQLPVPVWDGHEDAIACYWKAWEIAFRNLKTPAEGSGFVSNFIDTAFNGNTFMWDSVFMLMFGKYADRIFKFQNTLNNLYAKQHADGFICREINEITGRDIFARLDPSSTGPEVMPWCEWEYFCNFGDRERLAKVFPPLMAYRQWMDKYHTWPDGTCFSTGWGCGMDNIPRMEPGYHDSFDHGHMIWVDACMQSLFSCNILIKMAQVLGRTEFIPELEAQRERMRTVINEKLWDEETGFYYDLWRNRKHSMVKHIGAFWAMVAECAPADRLERLAEHLTNQEEFNTDLPVPSLSKDNPNFRMDGGYWRGGVWAPTNYMVLKGLDVCGKYDLSHRIGYRFLNAAVDVFNSTGTIFENYAPEFLEGHAMPGKPAKADFIGWSGIIPISVLFEYVFGIKPDAVNRKITWHIQLTERHGVQKYPFGVDGEMTLICNARSGINAKPELVLVSNIPVTVEVIWGDAENRQFAVYECGD